MDKAVLVDSDVQAGERLVNVLRRAHFPFSAAMWLLADEDDEYKLLIASKLVSDKGPLEAYSRLRDALSAARERTHVDLQQIELVKPSDRFIEALAEYLANIPSSGRTGKAVREPKLPGGRARSDWRLRNASIDNRFVRDAVIYDIELKKAPRRHKHEVA